MINLRPEVNHFDRGLDRLGKEELWEEGTGTGLVGIWSVVGWKCFAYGNQRKSKQAW